MSRSAFRPGWLRAIACLALTALLATTATAQSQARSGRAERADPLDAQTRVPAVGHVSSLAGYRRLVDDSRVDWKQANETVNRIGGWRTYAREAQQPEPAASAPAARSAPAPASTPAPAHGGHKMH